MVGHVRLTLKGEPGRTVKIRHGEVLNPDGTLYTANLRTAKATDHYTFATDQPETFEPSFTFHGFRYVEISGVDEAPAAKDLVGVVVGTDGGLTSSLDTSSDLVNQLHSNIVWGMRGNFLSIPTDTPARDERMGWAGDINVFARTAVYNMDAQSFLTKWLQDLRDTQRSNGSLPGVAPVVPGRFDGGYESAGWMDSRRARAVDAVAGVRRHRRHPRELRHDEEVRRLPRRRLHRPHPLHAAAISTGSTSTTRPRPTFSTPRSSPRAHVSSHRWRPPSGGTATRRRTSSATRRSGRRTRRRSSAPTAPSRATARPRTF